jgi:hypothetical protein
MLNTGCPSSSDWDRFLTDATGDSSRELRSHLATCPRCRFLLDQRAQDMEELSQAWSGFTVSLTCWDLHLDVPAHSERFAAKPAKSAPLSESIRLLSPDQRIMLQAVRDSRTNDIWLYLKADDPLLYQHILVRPFNWDREFLTDDAGRINLGPAQWPTPEQQVAELKLPAATLELVSVDKTPRYQEPCVLISPFGDEVGIKMVESGPHARLEIEILKRAPVHGDKPLKIAVRSRTSGQSFILEPGPAGLPTVNPIAAQEAIDVYLFV